MLHLWHDLPLDADSLEDGFDVVIEVPRGSRVKYELDKASGLIRVDRILSSAVYYPANYGFIPRTYCDDKDPLDVLVLGEFPVSPGALMEVRPIGVMHMVDGGEDDDKLLAVCTGDPVWKHARDLADVPPHFLAEIEEFFRSYKALEKKSVEVHPFEGRQRAFEVLRASIVLYAEHEAALRG